MDFIPKYLEGKNNRDSVTYDCPQLIPILEPTYGCIVYQEQVMQIVRDLAGYSLGQTTFSVEQCQKETGSNGKGTPKLRVWKPGRGCKRLYQKRHK